MREFKLTLHDCDGEEHEYNFFAGYPLEITEHVLNRMRYKGDFFGHEHLKTQDVNICELVAGTLGADAIDLSTQTPG